MPHFAAEDEPVPQAFARGPKRYSVRGARSVVDLVTIWS